MRQGRTDGDAAPAVSFAYRRVVRIIGGGTIHDQVALEIGLVFYYNLIYQIADP